MQPTPHPHAALIAEWIKDTSRVVEYRMDSSVPWKYAPVPAWCTDYQYRFKPQPKPDVVKYHNCYVDGGHVTLEAANRYAVKAHRVGVVMHIYDGETGVLKSVEKLD